MCVLNNIDILESSASRENPNNKHMTNTRYSKKKKRKKVDCSILIGQKIWIIISESCIFQVVLIYIILLEILWKISSQYLNPNLNYELFLTHKWNLALQSNMAGTHNEMHKSTHSSKLLIKTILWNVKNVVFHHDITQATWGGCIFILYWNSTSDLY